ncbi:MAG: hypothetical protein QOC75_5289 [Pseudonocardiales bacterium]|nr:hypothetical protein [Pseudonocardiales bacterium]
MRPHRAVSRPIHRAAWAALIVVLVALAGWGAASAVGAGPAASAAKSCKVPSYPGSGYFTSLKVRGTSCNTGRRVTLAHYRCRVRNGISGRCHHRVLRFGCSESRQSIPTEIVSRVTCRRGAAKVVYTYQQNR